VVSSSEPCPGGLGLPLPCPRVSPSPCEDRRRAVPVQGVPEAEGQDGHCPPWRRRVVYRTEYRQAVRTDYRRRYQCCQGYYESRDSCVPHCSQECVHGRCVAPELCQCEPGWRGPSCSSECDERSWGPDCGQRCQCHHGAPCDPLTGLCSCPPGFTDPLCRQPCPPGTYGQGCHLSCPCHHQAPCNASTGCVCLPGWAGLYCNESCPPGYFGPGCLQSCLCLHGGVCDGTTGHCHCPPGWHGPDCSKPCPAGSWGPSCNRSCDCAHGAPCDPQSGTCHCPPGWQGPRCLQPCLVSPAGCAGAAGTGAWCHHPALTVPTLQNGTFGAGCGERCACAHADGCDPVTGECHCLPGWTGKGDTRPWGGPHCAPQPWLSSLTVPAGPQCEQGCPHGSWGRGCLMSCSCRNGASCSPQDGSCTCTPGFRGPTCQRREWPPPPKISRPDP
uniref:Platelet endothelial aggregation receptor 1 n=1 Tax=Ficedula albicollis TaxID=59894 RepID=A0A803WFS0_FICAL